jgi:hypothetical protein
MQWRQHSSLSRIVRRSFSSLRLVLSSCSSADTHSAAAAAAASCHAVLRGPPSGLTSRTGRWWRARSKASRSCAFWARAASRCASSCSIMSTCALQQPALHAGAAGAAPGRGPAAPAPVATSAPLIGIVVRVHDQPPTPAKPQVWSRATAVNTATRLGPRRAPRPPGRAMKFKFICLVPISRASAPVSWSFADRAQISRPRKRSCERQTLPDEG